MSADWDDWLADVVAAFGADSGTLHALAGEGVLHLVAAVPEMPDEVMEKIQVIPVGKGMAGMPATCRPTTAATFGRGPG